VFEKLKQGIKGVIEISNDVAVEVAQRVCQELKERLAGVQLARFGDKTEPVKEALRESIEAVMATNGELDILELVEGKEDGEPLIIMFVGINGTGKTTTIAKVSKLLMNSGHTVVLASGDTYRAGAIEQLEEHARRLGVRVIKHAAVSFDAVQHARAQGIDVVLIDTAGRMQTNRNLMDELQKIKRVVQPDLTVMVLDALIGNDAVDQAQTFNEIVGFDAAILTKVDADAKGGSSLSVAYLTGKPIIYVGVGQEYGDLQPFDAAWFAEKILADT